MPALPYSGINGQAPAGSIGLPDNYTRVNADPGAFGAGTDRALQGLGQAGVQAGDSLIDEATREQAFHNAGAVTDMMTQAQQAAMNLQYGDPNDPNSQGFYALKGKEALAAYPDTVKKIQAAYEMSKGNLTTDAQRQLFDRESRRTLMTTLSTMGRHRIEQQQAYGMETQAAAVELNKRAGELAYTNDNLFDASTNAAVMHRNEMDAMQGLPDEVKEVNRNRVIQEMWVARVQRMGADDPDAAMAMLKRAGDRIDAPTQAQLIGHLQPKLDQQVGGVAGRYGWRAAGGGGGPSSMPADLPGVAHQLESGGSMAPGIVGDKGQDGQPQAFGPMQVHGAALADVNAKLGTSYTLAQLRDDPKIGKRVGDTYLQMQRDRYGRDDYALGAYNQGPGAMDAAIASGKGVAGLPGGGRNTSRAA